ncbi:MAG: hypothetical protein ACE5EG_08065, partial [Thermoanaerobaculia bacterium]
MSSRNREVVLLVVLFAAFVWVVGRQLMPALGGGAGGSSRRAAAGGPAAATDGPLEIAELRLEALEHKPATYQPGRDPFRCGPRP